MYNQNTKDYSAVWCLLKDNPANKVLFHQTFNMQVWWNTQYNSARLFNEFQYTEVKEEYISIPSPVKWFQF